MNQSEWGCCIFIFMNTDKDKKGNYYLKLCLG